MRFTPLGWLTLVLMAFWCAVLVGCAPVPVRSTDYPGGVTVREWGNGSQDILLDGVSYPVARRWDRGDTRDVLIMSALAYAAFFAVERAR